MGFGVWGLGFGVWGLGFGVKGLGHRVLEFLRLLVVRGVGFDVGSRVGFLGFAQYKTGGAHLCVGFFLSPKRKV